MKTYNCVIVFNRDGLLLDSYFEGMIQGICIGLIDKDKPDLGYDCEHFDHVTIFRTDTTEDKFEELKQILLKILGADRFEFHVMSKPFPEKSINCTKLN